MRDSLEMGNRNKFQGDTGTAFYFLGGVVSKAQKSDGIPNPNNMAYNLLQVFEKLQKTHVHITCHWKDI